jgi:hypothetical protein
LDVGRYRPEDCSLLLAGFPAGSSCRNPGPSGQMECMGCFFGFGRCDRTSRTIFHRILCPPSSGPMRTKEPRSIGRFPLREPS